jgi:DNA repair exonuclease SbcCD nuclease subunit
MEPVRALQIADVHLDGSISSKLFPPDKQKERRKQVRETFERAVDLSIERSVDVVLIPGDLWDDESVQPDTVGWLADLFQKLNKHDIPVYIAPGNHDFFAPGSGYSCEFRQRERLPDWPANVHVFTSGEFETRMLSNHSDVTITGRAFRENVLLEERLLSQRVPRPEDSTIQILLFHGSRLKGIHPEGKPLITAPFEDEELLAQGFSYTALGHYHTYQTIKDAEGRIRAAYSGCPAGRTLAEVGEKGALILEIEPNGVPPEAIEFVRLDTRRILKLSVDLTGASHQEAMTERVLEEVRQAGAQPEDILYIRLTGRHPPGVIPDISNDSPLDRYWHVCIVNAAEPDYDLEAYCRGEERTVDARFARELLRRLDETTDAQERATLKEALYLGLDALIQGRITVREFDLQPEEAIEP